MWDEVRAALVTSEIQRENREDARAIAAAEIALMRLADRGGLTTNVVVHVAGETISGRVVVWTDGVVILDLGPGACAVRTGAIDAVEGLSRALHSPDQDFPTVRSLLDAWSGHEVDVTTSARTFRGPLVVASDHLEVGAFVIPWSAVRTVRWRG